jgi:hypothetical protein
MMQKSRRRVFFVLLLPLMCPGLYSLGAAEKAEAGKVAEYRAVISGIIRLVGNDPFPRLLVTSDDGKDYIVDEVSPARKELHSMQGRRVQIEALVREYPVYAGKKYLGIEYVITPERCDFLPQDAE